jgi:ADP-ribose pyrophosphatase
MSDPIATPSKRHWTILSQKVVYPGRPWLEVTQDEVLLPSGRTIPDFHAIWMSDYAILFAETDDGQVLLGRVYKQGVGQVTLTFPGGAVDEDEDVITAAKRELLEETGYTAREWTVKAKMVVHANYGCGHAHFVHAKGLTKVQEPPHDDTEELTVEFYPRSALRGLLERGEIVVMDCAAMLGVMGV